MASLASIEDIHIVQLGGFGHPYSFYLSGALYDSNSVSRFENASPFEADEKNLLPLIYSGYEMKFSYEEIVAICRLKNSALSDRPITFRRIRNILLKDGGLFVVSIAKGERGIKFEESNFQLESSEPSNISFLSFEGGGGFFNGFVVPRDLYRQGMLTILSRAQSAELLNYDCGQADMCILRTDGRPALLFDFGLPIPIERPQNFDSKAFQAALNGFNGEAVILSHFHFDHYGLIYRYKGVRLFQKKWYLPDLTHVPNYFKSVFQRIVLCGGSINSVSKSSVYSFSCSGIPICLARGNGSNLDLNNSGIVCYIGADDMKKALLTGDCNYSYLPASMINECVDFLHIPHHGAETCTIPTIQARGGAVAFVSYGLQNHYGHPGKSHLLRLEMSGFRIEASNANHPIYCFSLI